jgi:drug/metabolite transporter (DMT)-like permease
MRTIGIVLIIAGILMLIFRGFNFTEKKKVVDLGPVEINKNEKHRVGWPIYAGGIAVAAGVIIVLAGNRKK